VGVGNDVGQARLVVIPTEELSANVIEMGARGFLGDVAAGPLLRGRTMRALICNSSNWVWRSRSLHGGHPTPGLVIRSDLGSMSNVPGQGSWPASTTIIFVCHPPVYGHRGEFEILPTIRRENADQAGLKRGGLLGIDAAYRLTTSLQTTLAALGAAIKNREFYR